MNRLSKMCGCAIVVGGLSLLTGCHPSVRDDVLSGLRDGTVSAVDGVIGGWLDRILGLAGSEAPDGAPSGGEDGNDRFIRL